MKLTDEQKLTVICSENRIVSSCPGSGKTRTIIQKILSCVETVRDTSRKVACITYTNAAASEIESRLLDWGSAQDTGCYEVNTIHSFCLNNIVRPYGHLIKELKTGFNILTLDSDFYKDLTYKLIQHYGLQPRIGEFFQNISYDVSGDLIIPEGITEVAAQDFIQTIRAQNLVTFSDILYFSYKIIKSYKYVSRGLSSRFAWILVDEFQDTTDLQVEILKEIHNNGNTKFFLVGDPNQSIYGFAGARPDLMQSIGVTINAKVDISLSGNFRSSNLIVGVAERLCAGPTKMLAVGENATYPIKPKYINANSSQEAILGYFLPEVERLNINLGSTAILAPWWTTLFPLSRVLRERGIPIVGPGARPYKRSMEFSQFSESVAAYLVCKDSEGAVICQRALFFLILQLTSEPLWKIYHYEGKKVLCELLNMAEITYGNNKGALNWLLDFGRLASEILFEKDFINKIQKQTLLESIRSMADSIKQNVPDFENMGIEELGIFARPSECIHLMTMHASKGREFDAVAVIDFHEGKVPDFRADADGREEGKRLAYVAATRAKKLLMFFTDNSHYKNQPSRFLGPSGMGLL